LSSSVSAIRAVVAIARPTFDPYPVDCERRQVRPRLRQVSVWSELHEHRAAASHASTWMGRRAQPFT
jgi:hypothetical protein